MTQIGLQYDPFPHHAQLMDQTLLSALPCPSKIRLELTDHFLDLSVVLG